MKEPLDDSRANVAGDAAGAPVRVAVDAMGGDHAPDPVLAGIDDALAADPALTIILVGPAEIVESFAASRRRIVARVAADAIGMGEHPASAVRGKPDSSIVVGCRLVKEGEAQAFFSAGSTGAMMAAGTLITGRIRGVSRPAIATVIPTSGPPCILLDVGANADCKPENLLQFAHMGSVYATVALGVSSPRVALLNIGEEPTKGSQLAQEAHALIAGRVPGFVGNVEGRDISAGVADVIVTDGFTGNVALKVMEGVSSSIFAELRSAFTTTTIAKLAGLAVRPSLHALRERLDPDAYGGAPLLGVDGVIIIGHGSSGRRAIASAIRVSATAARGGLSDRIGSAIARDASSV